MPSYSENHFTHFELLRDKFSELTDEHIKITRHVFDTKTDQLTYEPGGRYSIYPRAGRCGPAPHTLTLFKTNITDFPTLFKTELRFLIPCLRHLKLRLQEVVWPSCCVINGNLKSTEVNIN